MNQKLNDAHEELIEYALALPGAFEDHPWGERVAKVGKKVFVFFGKSEASDPRLGLAVKLPQSSLAALDQSFTEPTGYGLGKSGWVSATFHPGEKIPVELLRAWVLESYRAIAPKKLLKTLDGASAPAEAVKPGARKASDKKKPAAKKPAAKKPISKR